MDRGTAEQILRKVEYWHYPFDLPWGRSRAHKPGHDERHLLRRQHFFKPLLDLYGGSLEGLSVLDLGCCQGFWSFECVKAGSSSVLGLDSSEAFIQQAVALKTIFDLSGCEFRKSHLEDESWWDQAGLRAVTLFLGLFYHLSDPILVLRKAMKLTLDTIIVDTEVAAGDTACLFLRDRDSGEPTTCKSNLTSSIRVVPTLAALIVLLKGGGFRTIQVLSPEPGMPEDYLNGSRVSIIARR